MRSAALRGLGRRASLLSALLLCGIPASADELAGVENPDRARTNYILRCQGCHGADGEGSVIGNVPRMQGFVGNFLGVAGGREFLVQVPGSATSALPDAALAEVLNWLLPTISGNEMPADFVPYGGEEVGRLRKSPLIDVAGRRAALLEAMGQKAGTTTP